MGGGNRPSSIPLLLLAVVLASCSGLEAPPGMMQAAAPLLARRDQCPANTFHCPTSLGAAFDDVCCQNGQTCALDASNQPACCPSGAVCTGAAPAGIPTLAPVSYVPNQYFSFPYAATSFTNSASCASAVKACSSNYDACVANLQGNGGRYAVTVQVPGGQGTTVGGAPRSLGASATSVCTSLSSEACSRLEATKCESFGQGSGACAVHPPPPPVLALVAGAGVGFALCLGIGP